MNSKDNREKYRKRDRTKTQAVLQVLQDVERVTQRQGLTLSTIKKKQRILGKVLRNLPQLTPAALNKFLQTYRTARKGQELQASTKNSIRAEVRWLLTHVQPQAWTPDFQTVLQRERVQIPGRKISPKDFDQLLMFAPTSTHALAYQLIWGGGFRPHELLSLTSDHVDFLTEDQAIISVPTLNPKVSSKKNKTGHRSIYLEGEVVEELAVHLRQSNQAGEPYLFPWSTGTLSTTFCRMKHQYNEWARANHVPPFEGRLYDLRHSVATRLASEGMPEYLLRKIMGWSPSSTMPSVYLHLDEQDLIQWFTTNPSPKGLL
ncbi:MAG: tyrosine-type recombinase/integrase [Candidatus Hermodarchaeota archaeon]